MGGGKRRHCRAISRGEVFIIVLSFHAAKLGLYFHICKFFSCHGRHRWHGWRETEEHKVISNKKYKYVIFVISVFFLYR